MRSYNAIEAMDFEPSDSAKVVGSNQASATTIYFLSIISQYPATIRIDSVRVHAIRVGATVRSRSLKRSTITDWPKRLRSD
jgi:hypothetical protein